MPSSNKPSRNKRTARLATVAFVLFSACLLFFGAGRALAQSTTAPASNDIQLAKPKLEIPIPGIDFASTVKENGNVTIPWLSQYISGVYNFLLTIVGTVAAVMMMVGGFQYLTAGGDKNRVDAGKKHISDALIGMVLVLGSYTILYVISPDLVQFRSLRLLAVTTEQAQLPTGVPEELVQNTSPRSSTKSTGSGKMVRYCGTVDACVPICQSWGCGTTISDNNCDFSKMPSEGEGMINPDSPDLIPGSKWPKMKNITLRSNSVRATQAVIDGLKRADAYLSDSSKPYGGKGYTIQVNNCWRDYRGDAAKECGIILGDHNVRSGSPVDKNPNDYGLAWPGVGPHSSGIACDLELMKDGGRISGIKGGEETCLSKKDTNQIFVEIMTGPDVGARRLNFEAWHFEWDGPTSCRCTGSQCAAIWPIVIPHCAAYPGVNTAC